MSKPMVTQSGIFSMQVCVPADWTDEQVHYFANHENPAGTSNGWRIRKDGDKERVICGGADSRPGFVHVMLDC